jgi:hypothetical protein
VDIVEVCGSMEEVMMRHFNGFAGSALDSAAGSDAFSFTVAANGATRAGPEHPEKAALAMNANAIELGMSGLRVLASQIVVGHVFAGRIIAGLEWAR